MIFGNAMQFAIEANIISSTFQHIYGDFIFHIGGSRIGNSDVNCDLSASARWGRTFLRASSRRKRPDLDQRSVDDVFDQIYGSYVAKLSSECETSFDTAECYQLPIWDRDPYVLDDIGEASIRDEYGMCAIERSDGTDRLIVMNFATSQLSEFIASAGLVDRVVSEYCSWVESLSVGQ